MVTITKLNESHVHVTGDTDEIMNINGFAGTKTVACDFQAHWQ